MVRLRTEDLRDGGLVVASDSRRVYMCLIIPLIVNGIAAVCSKYFLSSPERFFYIIKMLPWYLQHTVCNWQDGNKILSSVSLTPQYNDAATTTSLERDTRVTKEKNIILKIVKNKRGYYVFI